MRDLRMKSFFCPSQQGLPDSKVCPETYHVFGKFLRKYHCNNLFESYPTFYDYICGWGDAAGYAIADPVATPNTAATSNHSFFVDSRFRPNLHRNLKFVQRRRTTLASLNGSNLGELSAGFYAIAFIILITSIAEKNLSGDASRPRQIQNQKDWHHQFSCAFTCSYYCLSSCQRQRL